MQAFRDNRAPASLDYGRCRNDDEGNELRGGHGLTRARWSRRGAATRAALPGFG